MKSIDPIPLHVPLDWSADRSGREGSSVVLFSPTVEDGFRANVNVIVHDLAPLTQDEYLTMSRLQLRCGGIKGTRLDIDAEEGG